MCEVIILTILPDLTQTEFDALLRLVAPKKQERIRRYHFYRDAQNSLLGDILIRSEICRITRFNKEKLDFSTNEYDKPFLTNCPDVQFNISHTGHYVACAVANKPVGIDIESIKPVDLIIAKRFFAPDETEYIMNGNQTRRFFEIWTKKESRIKWEGKGLSKPLPSFSVFNPIELEELAYHEVFQNEEVICHVCLCDKNKPSIRHINTKELLSELEM